MTGNPKRGYGGADEGRPVTGFEGGYEQTVPAPLDLTESRTAMLGRIAAGMEVVGTDGAEAGVVKGVREGDFLVGLFLERDVYVPFDAVRNVTTHRIILDIRADQIDSMGWPHSSLA